MCSIGEDDFGDEGGVHSMPEDPKRDDHIEELCKKCNNEKTVIKLDFMESKCRTCFMTYVRHKFRATLGSTKIVRRGSNVLLYFNANAESVCLLELIRQAFEQESYKRLCFELELIYIDENCVNVGSDVNKRLQKVKEVQSVLEQFSNFRCFYTSIASSTNELPIISSITLDKMQLVIESEVKFTNLCDDIKSLTSKQDFLFITRNDKLRHAAIAINCQYVFLPEIGLNLAKRLLSNISLGRGSSVASDVAFCDDRIQGLKFIRPIKDLSAVEVSSFIKFSDLRYLNTTDFGEDLGKSASIQNLTSSFIEGLQKNYSSTVSTVFRTCSKITPSITSESVAGKIPENFQKNLNISNLNQRCILCKSFLDYQNSETLFAIEFSRFVSESVGNCQHGEAIEQRATEALSGKELRKHLCHGCRNIFIGLDDATIEEALL